MEFLAFSQTKLGSSFDITRARVNKASVIPLLSSFVFSVPPSRRKVLGAKSKQAGKKEGGLGNSAFPLRNQIVDSPATCPNTWRAEPRKKNTLSFFKRNFTPAKSEMQGVFFLSGLPRLCEAVAERFIHHWDFARNTFELCPEHTARKRNRVRMQKYGRHEVPSVLNSPQKILNLKGFATQSVAPR